MLYTLPVICSTECPCSPSEAVVKEHGTMAGLTLGVLMLLPRTFAGFAARFVRLQQPASSESM